MSLNIFIDEPPIPSSEFARQLEMCENCLSEFVHHLKENNKYHKNLCKICFEELDGKKPITFDDDEELDEDDETIGEDEYDR